MKYQKLTRNTEYLVLYEYEYYTDCTNTKVYELDEIEKLIKHMGIKYKTLIEYICKGRKLCNGMTLYRKPTKKRMKRII